MFEDFYIKLLNKNIKIVPLNAFVQLITVSLAFWFMVEGSFNKIKGYLTLCTDSYSKEDVLRLISILTTKFNLSCGLINNGKTKDGNFSYALASQARILINKSTMPGPAHPF